MSNVLFTSEKTRIKSGFGYKPCVLEITDEYFAYRVGSLLAGMVTGGVGGIVGWGAGQAISGIVESKNGFVVIPRSMITNVTAKKGFATVRVIIETINTPPLDLACFSKKDMETIAGLLSK